MEIILLFIVCLNISLGGFIFLHNAKSPENYLFSLMCLIASAWTFANFMISIFPTYFWVASSYGLGALLISTGFAWTLCITEGKLTTVKKCILILLALCFMGISYKPGFIPSRFELLYSDPKILSNFDWGMVCYTIFYAIMGLLIIIRLYRFFISLKPESDRKKQQIKLVLIGASVTLVTTAINSFVLPFLFIYISKGIDSIGFFVFLSIVTYTIARHSLFNIKLIILELVIFTLWILLLTRLLFSTNFYEIMIQAGIFLMILVFGILLIQNVLQVIKQRKEIEDLANSIQTHSSEVTHSSEEADDSLL